MSLMPLWSCRLLCLLVAPACWLAATAAAGEAPNAAPSPAPETRPRVDFVRDIQPLLARHCLGCHGPDLQEGRLRLDAREIVLRGGFSGPAVVPGYSDRSVLFQRIAGIGEEDRMPLDAEPLSDAQVDRIRTWIDQGGHWPDGVGVQIEDSQRHWAYVQPVRPQVPTPDDRQWVRNPVDAFILARLEEQGLSVSPRADKWQLIRRLTLDLTGLPPTPKEIDDFLADDSADAYDKLVDRLLASPRYGERWAVPWLDAARFADSNGYQRDGRREVWAFRDWVIRALNDDKPFDQFTVEQIAGDLLPDTDPVQLVATGFHRGTMANVEAGTDPEEEHVLAIIDRVNTTGAVWLGTTLECAQCHNHKYDPFSQKEYYQLYAFFNNTEKEIEATDDKSIREFVGPKMTLPLPQEMQMKRHSLQEHVRQLEQEIEQLTAELENRQPQWENELAEVPDWVTRITAIPPQERTRKQKQRLSKFYLAQSQPLNELRTTCESMQAEVEKLAPPTTLVMKELPEPRTTRVFQRGDFLHPGETVSARTPDVLHPIDDAGPPNRMTLARWLIDENNPLTPRVIVNRHWAAFFGRGIVDTMEDFGSQSSPPTHPKLLDWLATEFVRRNWSQKAVHRLIVTSAAYQQSSRLTPELLAADPYNKFYARAPRLRLTAEFIRDSALAAAGLLSDKLYGPPVFPFQPPGVWNHTGRASNDWTTSSGEDLYRRGVYVYWRRTVPYPSFVNFDAPRRETCTVARSESNTPLQALTLMNDRAFFEAAAALAGRMIRDRSQFAAPAERAAFGFRLVTGRQPGPDELQILVDRFEQELSRYQSQPEAAAKLASLWRAPAAADSAEFAAWTHVASVLLNLDEFITRG